jgi:spore coat protein SA
MIYHLLPELEPFSATRGGAISHTVANLMRMDPSRSVVCAKADESWGYPVERVMALGRLAIYRKLKGRQYYPQIVSAPLLRAIYSPLLSTLHPSDIVWCHNQPRVCASLQDAIHARGAKLIYHSHDGWAPRRVPHLIRSLRPDAWIFVSAALRKEWLALLSNPENTHVVHNGADETLFFASPQSRPQERDAPTILYAGRLHPEKGAHILMDALKVLNARGVRFKCRFVGSSFASGSASTTYVRSLIRNCPENVELIGHVSAKQIAAEFRSSDIFCCPSLWQEPFGKVNIEAMACGLPVVASRVGGIPEIASQGGVILVEPGSVAKLASALERLLVNPDLRQQLAKQGVKSFRNRFRWISILDQYRCVLNTL